MDRLLVVTADDFGVSEEANRAIAAAHTDGVLTSASIMVGEATADHAARIARELPGLGVGLHVTLSDGRSVQSRADAPMLVGRNGRFRRNPASAGMLYWFARGIRLHIRREVAAQFERCERLGLRLDHADGHQHLHVHPVIWDILLAECVTRGIGWVRVPSEPWPSGSAGSAPGARRRLEWAALRALARRCRRSALAHGIRVADAVIGHVHTGAMDEARVVNALERVEPGVTELYAHPGAHDAELRALTAERVRRAIEVVGIRLVTFGNLGR